MDERDVEGSSEGVEEEDGEAGEEQVAEGNRDEEGH